MVNLVAVQEQGLREAPIKSSITASIVVPAYNEEKGLPVVLRKLLKAVDGVCEIIVVDDGSSDATSEVASRFPCRLIRHERNRGKGEAVKTGVRHARGEYVILVDADDTYPSEAIPQMIEALESCDVIYGSRSIGRDNIPRLNRIGNKLLHSLIRYGYGFKASDYATGLYGLRRHCLERMNITSRGFAIEPEIAIKASRMGLRVEEMFIEYRPRLGKSKLCGRKAAVEHLKTILRHILWQPANREA